MTPTANSATRMPPSNPSPKPPSWRTNSATPSVKCTHCSLSLAHSYLGDGQSALDGAHRLAALADASGDPLTIARAGNARTVALLTLRRWQETVRAGAETARAYRAANSRRKSIAYALNAQGIALLAHDDPRGAAPVLEEARHEASLMENPRAEGVCLLNLSWAYWCDGPPPATVAGAAGRPAASPIADANLKPGRSPAP